MNLHNGSIMCHTYSIQVTMYDLPRIGGPNLINPGNDSRRPVTEYSLGKDPVHILTICHKMYNFGTNLHKYLTKEILSISGMVPSEWNPIYE